MFRFRYLGLVLLLLGGMLTPLQAEEVWVRNKLFKGRVTGSGSAIAVELRAFAKAMKIDIDVQDGRVVFGEASIAVKESGGVEMVSLHEFSAASGLKVKANPSLGTIDVYPGDVGTGSSGDWSAVNEKSGKGSKTVATGETHDGGIYTIKVSSKVEMTDDPALMGALQQYAVAGSNMGAMSNAMQIEFVMTPKKGSNDAVLLMMVLKGMPANMTADEESELTEAFMSGAAKRGEVVGQPSQLKLGGHTFYKAAHREEDRSGPTMTETYVNWSNRYRTGMILMISDSEKTFKSSAAVLRPIVRSLRIKK